MAATFSAALLAGGKSRRMGRDKALLPVGNQAHLWQRQLALLEKLAPRRIFWSGHARPGLPAEVTVVPDAAENAGPLAGISACLDALEDDLLLVLAVDLPCMNAAFLSRLLLERAPGHGAVPRRDGRFEPLAAVYPREMRGLARRHLDACRLAMQNFAAEGIEAGLLDVLDVSPEEFALFHNLNRPEDLERFSVE